MMDDIKRDIEQLQYEMHELDKHVALLSKGQEGLVGALKDLTTTVTGLNNTMLEARGAVKFVNAGWGVIGVLAGAVAAWAAIKGVFR